MAPLPAYPVPFMVRGRQVIRPPAHKAGFAGHLPVSLLFRYAVLFAKVMISMRVRRTLMAPESFLIALIQVATGVGSHFYHLALLQLVYTDRIHTFDSSWTIGQGCTADATRVKVLNVIEPIMQYITRF